MASSCPIVMSSRDDDNKPKGFIKSLILTLKTNGFHRVNRQMKNRKPSQRSTIGRM